MKTFSISKKENLVNNIKFMIFNNFKIKLICCLLAIGVYFAVGFFQRNTKTYTSELEIVKLKDFLTISNPIPDTIKITVKDKTSILEKITDKDFNVRLDLSDIDTSKETKVKLKWNIPKTMTSFFSSIKIEPEELDIKVEKRIEKNVKVDLVRYGDPAKGFLIKKITIDPESIRVQGPKSLLENLTNIKTETINIEGIKESFGRQLIVVPESPRIKSLGKVYVFFEIIQDTEEKILKFQSLNFENLKDQFKASINRIIILKIEGPKMEIAAIDQNNINLYVDCSNIVYPGDYPLEIKVKLQENFIINSIIPEKVVVTVEDRQ